MDDSDLKKPGQRQSLKPVAFAATVFSTVAITSCMIIFPLILHYIQTLESNVQLDLDFCKSRARDIWKEMLEIKTGGRKDAARLARIILTQRRLQKRDTLADFWSRRLHDYQLRDDPVDRYGRGGYAGVQSGGYGSQTYETPKPKPNLGINQPDPYSSKPDQFVETPSVGCKFLH